MLLKWHNTFHIMSTMYNLFETVTTINAFFILENNVSDCSDIFNKTL